MLNSPNRRFLNLVTAALLAIAMGRAMAIEPIQSFPSSPDGKRPTPLAILTQHIMMTGEDLQRLYADIMLTALLEEYHQVTTPPKRPIEYSPKMARKVYRWNKATAGIIEALSDARQRLSEGAPFALNVDLQNQVMVILDNEPLLIAGPQLDDRKSKLEDWIIGNFCNLNDCSWVNFNPAPPKAPEEEAKKPPKLPHGNWVLQQGRHPAFTVGDQLVFEFNSLDERDKKTQICRQAADEVQRLSLAIKAAGEEGMAINWLALERQLPAPDQALRLGTWHRNSELRLPTLSRLHTDDWQRLVEWLQANSDIAANRLHIRQASALMGKP